MLNKKIYDVAIIGAGPVGIFSVFANGMQNLSCALIDAGKEIGGQCVSLYGSKNIYDIPAYEKITAFDLIENLKKQAFIFNPDLYLESFVANISQKDNIFQLDIHGKDSILSKSIIIALGSGIFAPVKPEVEGIDNEKVIYSINSVKDFMNKTIGIIGAGDSAIDWALELKDYAKQIYLIHRRDVFKAHNYNVEQVKRADNISFKIPNTMENLTDEGDFLKVTLDNGEVLNVDYLLPCLGIKSYVNFLDSWNLKLKNNRINVNFSNMQTSQEGIYAIGDCVFYEGKRKLIASGFHEAFTAAASVYKFINPEVAPIIGHSTSLFEEKFLK